MVADDFTSPLALVTAPGDARRFVVDQIGLVHILDEDGNVHDTSFLDIRDRLMTFRPGFDERGLLDLAFHPDHERIGRFFVYCSAPLRNGVEAGETPFDPEDEGHLGLPLALAGWAEDQ